MMRGIDAGTPLRQLQWTGSILRSGSNNDGGNEKGTTLDHHCSAVLADLVIQGLRLAIANVSFSCTDTV
jgi:hypothetical protein